MTTNKELVAIFLRICSVLLIAYALRGVGYAVFAIVEYINSTGSVSSGLSLYVLLLEISLPVIAAVVLWKIPLTLAGYIIPGNESESVRSLAAKDLQTVGFSVMGLYITALGIIDLSHDITRLYGEVGYIPRNQPVHPQYIASAVSSAVEFVIGLFMLFSAKGLSAIVTRLRSA